jgi:hypothetical protein
MIGHEYFIQQRIYGCKEGDNTVQVSYPINGLVAWHFQDVIKNITADFDYFSTHAINLNITAPVLQILSELQGEDVLLEPYQGGVNFDKVRHLIQTDTANFRSESDKIWNRVKDVKAPFDFLGGIDLGSWHMPSLWSIFGFSGTTMVMIGLGVLFCCYCMRQGRANAMASAVTGLTAVASQVTGVSTAPVPVATLVNDKTVAFNEFKYRMYLLLAALTGYICYKSFKYIYTRYFAYKVIVPQIAGESGIFRCHLYLEIVNATDKILIYTTSIAANMQHITFCKTTNADILGVTNTIFNTFVNIRWTAGYFKLFRDIKCQFPSIIHVPMHKRWRATRICKGECHARVLILSDVYYSLHPLVNPNIELSKKDKKRKAKLLKQLSLKDEQEGDSRILEIITDKVATGSQGESLVVNTELKHSAILPEAESEID